jgi:hypothetical protein
MAKLSDRVDRLESLLGQFIVNTDVALRRLEASLYLSDEIVKYLTKKRIYAIALRDDTMDLLNFEKINK